MKICNTCGNLLPVDMFNKQSSSKDGLAHKCKACRREYRVKFYAENRERLIAEVIQYQKDNPDKVNERTHRYRLRHPEKEKARAVKYKQENAEKIKQSNKRYRDNNKEKVTLANKKYSVANAEIIRIKRKIYAQNNKGYINFRTRLRQARKRQATPSWANLDKIKELYVLAQQLELETGVKYHVDHIIPLTHPLVCGLHVENNLQVITAEENLSKGNKFPYSGSM